MMVVLAIGTVLITVAAWLLFKASVDYREGWARLDYWWTYPKLDAERSGDPLGFWLLLAGEIVTALALGYFAIVLMFAP
jgi:hypothetical protein